MSPHGNGCDKNHQHDDPEKGIQYSLFSKIDKNNLECLNEHVEGSGKNVFKSWEERLSNDSVIFVIYDIPSFNTDLHQFVESDIDEELLFNIPFTGSVKLKGIVLIGENSDSHPSNLRLFKNRPSMTFDDAIHADQEFELQVDTDGSLEYSPKIVTFQNVTHLSMHFPSNFGAERTKIYYIGLKGEFTEASHSAVVITNYEVRPNISDHKNPLEDFVNHGIS